jgi:hypothetical protein
MTLKFTPAMKKVYNEDPIRTRKPSLNLYTWL